MFSGHKKVVYQGLSVLCFDVKMTYLKKGGGSCLPSKGSFLLSMTKYNHDLNTEYGQYLNGGSLFEFPRVRIFNGLPSQVIVFVQHNYCMQSDVTSASFCFGAKLRKHNPTTLYNQCNCTMIFSIE